jgi:hypothetical protein
MTIDPKQPVFGPANVDYRAVEKEGGAPGSGKKAVYLAILAGLLSLLGGSVLAVRVDRRALLDDRLDNMPPDIVAWTRRNIECRKWLNFAVADEATDRRVEDAVLHLRCDVLAVDLQRMRRKYVQWPKALEAINAAQESGL